MQCNCGGRVAGATVVRGAWRLAFDCCHACGQQSGYRLTRVGVAGVFAEGEAARRLFNAMPERGQHDVLVRLTEYAHFEGSHGHFSSDTTDVLLGTDRDARPTAPGKIPGAVLARAAGHNGCTTTGNVYDVLLPIGCMLRLSSRGHGWCNGVTFKCVAIPVLPPADGIVIPADLPEWRDPEACRPRYSGRYHDRGYRRSA